MNEHVARAALQANFSELVFSLEFIIQSFDISRAFQLFWLYLLRCEA